MLMEHLLGAGSAAHLLTRGESCKVVLRVMVRGGGAGNPKLSRRSIMSIVRVTSIS